MADLVTLVVDKYQGSLKAEHGTGINMAPFVRHEWGEAATDMMWRIKKLADPFGVLAPNVILTRDDGINLKQFKSAPPIEDLATHCIECGFCEAVCPSRNVHPTCSTAHLGLTKTLERLAARLAGDVLVPVGTTCCGTAGDRGLLHPELVISATREEKAGLAGTPAQAYLSANRTCEMGLPQATGHPYESFVFLLEELTR